MANSNLLFVGNGFEVCVSNLHDVCELKDRLAPEIIAEVQACSNHSPEKALMLSYLASDICLTAKRKGRVIGMFGANRVEIPGSEGFRVGSVWALVSSEAHRLPKTVMEISYAVLPIFFESYDLLFNFVDARYTRSIAWLKHLGARFEEPTPWGVNNMDFCKFTLTREDLRNV